MTIQSALIYIAVLIGMVTNASRYAFANDTEAAVGIGGLVFTNSDDVEMLSEELYVSPEQIDVKYRFRNKSKDGVTTLVAFPLPDVKYDPDDEFGSKADLDVEAFKTTLDGAVVKLSLEQRALVGGIDQTNTLKRYGIPLNPYAGYDALSNETEIKKTELQRIGLLDSEGMPTWSMKKTFYWQQRFPSNREITIEHRYRPIVGGTVYTPIGSSKESDEQLIPNEKFCVDKELVAEVKRKTRPDSVEQFYNTSFSERWIEYILTTGANWAGPIRQFRLVVDKGREENLVSFCGEGVRKIGPTQFEFVATNFVPKRDLSILILEPTESPENLNDSEPPIESLATLACEELWLRRNSIFKAGGYCFKTPRAISKFGNAGCLFDDVDKVPLSRADRMLVGEFKLLEQRKRCPR